MSSVKRQATDRNKPGSRNQRSTVPFASAVQHFKNSSTYSVTPMFPWRLVFKHSWQTLGPHGLCQQLTDGQQNVLQVDKEGTGSAKQQESAQKELGMRRRVSLSLHRGLHAPHNRSRCLFRVYLPPLLFLLPVRPSWADRSSHYLTK